MKTWVRVCAVSPCFKGNAGQLKQTQRWGCSSGEAGGMDGKQSNGFKLKQVRFVLQSRGREWLVNQIENRYPNRVLLQPCSRVVTCTANVHSSPGRTAACLALMLSALCSPGVVGVETTHSRFLVRKSCCSLCCGHLSIFARISCFPPLPASVAKRRCWKGFSRW